MTSVQDVEKAEGAYGEPDVDHGEVELLDEDLLGCSRTVGKFQHPTQQHLTDPTRLWHL